MRNPWDVRPKASKGNTADEIHLAVGRALTQWERLEYSVAVIYGALISPERYSHAAVRAYGVVVASSGRLEMVKEAAKVALHVRRNKNLQDKLNDFLRRVGNFGARRNEIAHGVAVTINGSPSDVQLMPAFYNARKFANSTDGPSYRYAAEDITHYQTCFHALNEEAKALLDEIEPSP